MKWSTEPSRSLVPCFAGDAEPGYYNASGAVTRYYGATMIPPYFVYTAPGSSESHGWINNGKQFRSFVNAYSVNAQGDQIYMFEYTPAITGLSQSAGSMAGGHILTITGSGFSAKTGANKVEVGGIPCEVISETSTEVRSTYWQSAQASVWPFLSPNNLNGYHEYLQQLPVAEVMQSFLYYSLSTGCLIGTHAHPLSKQGLQRFDVIMF